MPPAGRGALSLTRPHHDATRHRRQALAGPDGAGLVSPHAGGQHQLGAHVDERHRRQDRHQPAVDLLVLLHPPVVVGLVAGARHQGEQLGVVEAEGERPLAEGGPEEVVGVVVAVPGPEEHPRLARRDGLE